MANDRQKSKQSQDNDNNGENHQPRPFWSGVIAFGLVTLPVSLFPANRGRAISLQMVDQQGNQLRRRYYCEGHKRMVERDELVRGYPVDKDQFIVVEDEDLEALAPEKTREIDLRRFVPLSDINPIYFERGYFLAPDSEATKAYRLLARVLEEEERAGIATFVMRDREYIVAIMAERGILRAETLRFHHQVRAPDQVGLPANLEEPQDKLKQQILKAMKARSRKHLDPAILTEDQTLRLQALVNEKLEQQRDVIEEAEPEASTEAESNVVDLMQVLKERLQGEQRDSSPTEAPRPEELNRDELYEQARKKKIAGRSKMTKDELAQALARTG